MDSGSEHARTAIEASLQREERAKKLAKAITERGVIVEHFVGEGGLPITRYSLAPEIGRVAFSDEAEATIQPQEEAENG